MEAQQREAAQNAQIQELQQQQAALTQQAATAGQQAPAAPPPQYAPPPPPPSSAQVAPEPAPAAPPARDPMEALKQLGELKAAGVITQEEFDAKKTQLLAQI